MASTYLPPVLKILQDAKKPLHYRKITEIALQQKLIPTTGQTPWYSLHRAICADMKAKGEDSAFVKTSPGIFSLKNWSGVTTLSDPAFQKYAKLLEKKKQMIFYGPPGTGKTHTASRFASWLTGQGGGTVTSITFHSSYSYEEFVEGFKPYQKNGKMELSLKDGIFKKICMGASESPKQKHILMRVVS